MKIISVDNFNRESYQYPDRLILQIRDESIAQKIAALMNSDEPSSMGYSDVFYKAVGDEYVLRKFDPNES
jgi:hypothetical protein